MAASHNHITMRMIAKEAGVSLASVSRVLSGSTHASAAVRNKVLSASKALGYTPSSIEGSGSLIKLISLFKKPESTLT